VISRTLAGRVLIAVGVLGVVAGLGGIVLGQLLVSSADRALTGSLTLTADTLVALEDAIAVTEQTIVLVDTGLARAETTTGDLAGTVGEGAALLRTTADLTEDRLAGSIGAFSDSLPGLIQVAGTIDTTLGALSTLPFGPTYSPDEPLDDSLRELQRSLAGVPEDLALQARLLRETGDSLEDVGEGTADIAGDLGAIRTGLGDALAVLRGSTTTAGDASALIGDTRAGLRTQLGLARLLIVLLGLTTAAGQLVPLALGLSLLRGPDAPLLREHVARDGARDGAR
jgi:hypothetical protein